MSQKNSPSEAAGHRSGEAPIGLFDSGIGGLTVLRAVRTALPGENFVYLGDTARLPYGSKSPETIERYLEQNVRFLESRGVKAVIVACNSASSVLVGRERKFSVPVYNVIEPGASAAIAASHDKRIGVLGTRATVSGGAYLRAIHALDPKANVVQQACPLLVPLVEEGWEDDPLTNLIVFRYLSPLLSAKIDTLIMGCTHYPVLREAFRKVVGNGVELVDSAEAIARLIQNDFASGRLKPNSNGKGRIETLVTDSSPAFTDVARRLMAPFELQELSQVDLAT